MKSCPYGFKRVELTQNSISGVIPFNLEYLKELVVLDLSFNKLTGTIPSSVGEVT
jgi:Leucine-rich repeat (LRR) protein